MNVRDDQIILFEFELPESGRVHLLINIQVLALRREGHTALCAAFGAHAVVAFFSSIIARGQYQTDAGLASVFTLVLLQKR